MKRNLIAHCQRGTSDKVYMACIRENPDGTYSVIGKWGRRGNTLQQSIKLSGATLADAESKAQVLFHDKLKGGYVDIMSSSYNGPVTVLTVQSDLEQDPAGIGTAQNPAPAPKKPKKQPPKKPAIPKEGVVVCLNNSGMVDKFDEGIEYVYEAHEDEQMLWVYDKLGDKQECFTDRFEIVDEKD